MKEKAKKIKVLVALSGGVDSSVAAALLTSSEKYEVTAAYMINYDNKKSGSESCWVPDYRDALRVAAALKISLLKLDFTKEYKEKVLDYMFLEYEKGRTPNPDVLCNVHIKFGEWLKKAKELGFDYLATGHYALTQEKNGHVKLLSAKDKNKDQTYFLHQLSEGQLKDVMFPVGKYTKEQVRKLAVKFGLPTAEREESMGICFVGEVPMKEFLETRISPKVGNVVTTDGRIVGQHEGLPFYTIGQRHIGISGIQNVPLFVVSKRSETNELVVGKEDDPMLFKESVELEKMHWISGQEPKYPLKCEVRLRHRGALQKCLVQKNGEKISVKFEEQQRAPTPGQFAVFYKKSECLGGGVIL